MTFSLPEITLFVVALTSLISLIRSFFNSKKLDNAILQIEIIHRATNSMKDDLVKEVREASIAKGIKIEQDNPTATSPLPVTDEKTAEKLDKVVEAIQEQSSLSQKGIA